MDRSRGRGRVTLSHWSTTSSVICVDHDSGFIASYRLCGRDLGRIAVVFWEELDDFDLACLVAQNLSWSVADVCHSKI